MHLHFRQSGVAPTLSPRHEDRRGFHQEGVQTLHRLRNVASGGSPMSADASWTTECGFPTHFCSMLVTSSVLVPSSDALCS